MLTLVTKVCSRCATEKPMEDFTAPQRPWCRTCVREYNAAYRQANRERLLRGMRSYQERNKEDLLAQKVRYREENREVIRERQRRFYRDNKEKYMAYRDKRNRLKAGLESDGSGRSEVWAQSEGICHLCLRPWSLDGNWEIDHVIPLQPRSGDPGADVLANKAVACRRCNRRKGNRIIARGAFACS